MGVEDEGDDLRRGRAAYEREEWARAREALLGADDSKPLAPDDLELLATALYMLGNGPDYLRTLERAYRAHLEAGSEPAAFRCAFWIGVNHARAGELGRAGGWLGRARRLSEARPGERVERGYLLLPRAFEQEAAGDFAGAVATTAEAAAIGERLADSDLFALAVHEQGHMLIRLGRTREGLRRLDEAMVAVTAGELSPVVAGIVYCGVILACQEAHEVRRAQEWTTALAEWCARQPDLVAFTGRCLIHRAELLQLHGDWTAALEEARRAGARSGEADNEAAAGDALYREGEIHRVRGDASAAERAYREASRRGREPQPGLALLRLAQGRREAAGAAIRRTLAETTAPALRAPLLSAAVEIELALGDRERAGIAASELEALAGEEAPEALAALAAHATGAVAVADGDPRVALQALRGAGDRWRALGAPYELARSRELAALACRALGDEDAAELELEAARATYRELDAAADLRRLDAGAAGRGEAKSELTARELEVLGHVAGGATNREIAAELVLSERTVDRHLSNIFAKLGVSSRAAATAHAYEHGLIRPRG